MKNNITAQRNTVGHKQKVSNKTTYDSSPKGVKGAQQSTKCMEVDSHRSFSLRYHYIPRVEAHSTTKSWDAHIHANDVESPW
jgi:hypothetical protein